MLIRDGNRMHCVMRQINCHIQFALRSRPSSCAAVAVPEPGTVGARRRKRAPSLISYLDIVQGPNVGCNAAGWVGCAAV